MKEVIKSLLEYCAHMKKNAEKFQTIQKRGVRSKIYYSLLAFYCELPSYRYLKIPTSVSFISL